MDEGAIAVRAAVCGHFTPSIDKTDDNTAGDENAVYFEDVHTGLLRVRSGYLPAPGSMGDRHTALHF